MKKRTVRFPLLVYAPLRHWGALGLLTALVVGALWLFTPRILGPTPLRPLVLLAALGGGVLSVYGYLAPRVAHVRCEATGLRLQGPLMPLFISYRRVDRTRLAPLVKVFDPKKDRSARRWPLVYWNMTAVVVDLKGFPVTSWWLRLWFDRHLFLPDGTGLVLLVEDWMGLSQQIDGALAAYRARRARR